MTFEPPVTVWLDASSGYRSGSRPMVTSPTAALNLPVASRPVTNSPGGSGTWVTASPIALQSPVTISAVRYAAGLEARSGLTSSILSGDFPFGRCQPCGPFVQPALASAIWAAPGSYGTGGSAAPSNRNDDGGMMPVAGPAAQANASVTISGRSIAASKAVRTAGLENSGCPGRRLSRTAVRVAPG